MEPQHPRPPQYHLAPQQVYPPAAPPPQHHALSPLVAEYAPAASSEPGLQFQDWLKILWARRWATFGVFILVMCATTLYSFKSTPVYQSACTILIEPQKAKVMQVNPILDPTLGSNYHQTQFDLLRSTRIAREALKTLREKASRDQQIPSLTKFMASTDIKLYENSRIIAVAYESHDPEFAARAANTIVQTYIEDTLSRESGMSDSGIRTLKLKEAELRPQSQAAEAEVRKFARTYGLALNGNQTMMSSELQSLRKKLGEVKSRRIEASALSRLREELDQASAKKWAPLDNSLSERLRFTMITRVGGDAPELASLVGLPPADLVNLRDLQQRKVIVESQLADLRKRYKDDHPYLKPWKAKLAYTHEEIKRERDRILVNVRNRDLALASEERALIAEIGRIEGRIASLNQKEIQLSMLRNRSKMLSDQHVRILKRIEELSLDSTISPEQHNLHIVDKARRPSLPIRPRPVRDLQIGALMGLLLGLALAFLLEYLDNTLKSKEGVERALGLPVLGFVPPVDPAFDAPAEKGPGMQAELVALRNTNSRVAESFRTIRTSLGFSLPGPAETTRTLLVTSSSSGEGKSFTAFNLALALSRAGRRVLLIDADMRKSKQHKLLGLESNQGLAMTLTRAPEDVDLSAVMPTEQEFLHLLPAGPKPPNPAEMVSSPSMVALLRAAEAAYDWIVVDAPPVNAVADPAALLAHVPHALFVVRPFYTTLKAAQRAREVMASTPAHTVGVVLNNLDVPPSREDKYHKYTDYYYYHGYGGRPEPPSEFPTIEVESMVTQPGPNGTANGTHVAPEAGAEVPVAEIPVETEPPNPPA